MMKQHQEQMRQMQEQLMKQHQEQMNQLIQALQRRTDVPNVAPSVRLTEKEDEEDAEEKNEKNLEQGVSFWFCKDCQRMVKARKFSKRNRRSGLCYYCSKRPSRLLSGPEVYAIIRGVWDDDTTFLKEEEPNFISHPDTMETAAPPPQPRLRQIKFLELIASYFPCIVTNCSNVGVVGPQNSKCVREIVSKGTHIFETPVEGAPEQGPTGASTLDANRMAATPGTNHMESYIFLFDRRCEQHARCAHDGCEQRSPIGNSSIFCEDHKKLPNKNHCHHLKPQQQYQEDLCKVHLREQLIRSADRGDEKLKELRRFFSTDELGQPELQPVVAQHDPQLEAIANPTVQQGQKKRNLEQESEKSTEIKSKQTGDGSGVSKKNKRTLGKAEENDDTRRKKRPRPNAQSQGMSVYCVTKVNY